MRVISMLSAQSLGHCKLTCNIFGICQVIITQGREEPLEGGPAVRLVMQATLEQLPGPEQLVVSVKYAVVVTIIILLG